MTLGPSDQAALSRAVELARHGVGEVEPNPPVGAVIYRGSEILAEGFHGHYGGEHAETQALSALQGPLPDDASMAVSLEPSCTPGKQPACTDALLQHRVRRLVVGETDPNPVHHGRGLELLRQAGVEVHLARPDPMAADLLAEFRQQLQRQRPYVILKWAATADQELARRSFRQGLIGSDCTSS